LKQRIHLHLYWKTSKGHANCKQFWQPEYQDLDNAWLDSKNEIVDTQLMNILLTSLVLKTSQVIIVDFNNSKEKIILKLSYLNVGNAEVLCW
jgi:hypothetical protein